MRSARDLEAEPGSFRERTRFLHLGSTRVAYQDDGTGPPLLLLHGCPFSSFVWRRVIPALRQRFRCLAPDLLGLGDTDTPPDADWSLPAQMATVLQLLDALAIEAADVVGHDHGGALAQLLAAEHPERVRHLVLMNAEAYDNWPSKAELPFVRLTQLPILGRLALWAWARPTVFKLTLREAHAVHDQSALTHEVLSGYIRANFGDARRRAKTRRFLAHQLDPANNRWTLDLVPGLRRFDHPTLLLWAADDPHFGPEWAEKLQRDIGGTAQLQVLPQTGHLLMEERPEEVARRITAFLTEGDE